MCKKSVIIGKHFYISEFWCWYLVQAFKLDIFLHSFITVELFLIFRFKCLMLCCVFNANIVRNSTKRNLQFYILQKQNIKFCFCKIKNFFSGNCNINRDLCKEPVIFFLFLCHKIWTWWWKCLWTMSQEISQKCS